MNHPYTLSSRLLKFFTSDLNNIFQLFHVPFISHVVIYHQLLSQKMGFQGIGQQD